MTTAAPTIQGLRRGGTDLRRCGRAPSLVCGRRGAFNGLPMRPRGHPQLRNHDPCAAIFLMAPAIVLAACRRQVALPASARRPESWFMMAGFLKMVLLATTPYGDHLRCVPL